MVIIHRNSSIDRDGMNGRQNGEMISGEKGVGNGATVDDAEVKPANNFIAGLKRLAKEKAAYDDAKNSTEKGAAPAAGEDADRLGDGNAKEKCRNSDPVNGNGVANESKVQNIPNMTGRIISVSAENQQPKSESHQPQSKSQQRRRGDTKQRSKKKSGTNPKKKPTSITELEDGLLPDMTGKEILVEQSELPSIEPVKEEIDLDDLISEEQSASTNRMKNTGGSSTGAAGAAGIPKNVNRRGLLNRSRSLKSNLTNSSTSEGSEGGGRTQLFAFYNDQSQRSLQTQTTVGTSGNLTNDDDLPQSQQQNSEPPKVISSYSNQNLRPSNSRRDRASSLHSSYSSYTKPTLGRIPSGGILPDVDEEIQGKVNEETQNKLSLKASTKSMPSRAQSWENLIAMDEQSRRASMDMEEAEEEEYRHPTSVNPHKANGLRSSRTSAQSQESLNSRDGGSRRSKRSDGRRRHGRRNSSSSENWKNESALNNSLMKDPEYVRVQATERFERGLDYAELGKLDEARERLLVALRYRVMDRGSLHPDVAATHEMLGYVEYFTAENKKNGDFEGSLVRLDQGADGLLGGNLTIMENPDKDGQSPSSSRSKNYEKAATHFQTALDILDAKELGLSNSKESAEVNGTSSKDETTFQWKECAETYSLLDEKGRLGLEERIEIVSRIQERMGELPVTVGEKSYATSFLSSLH